MTTLYMFLALIKKELLALSRDIHGMGALFLMPMVFIIVMSMALKDVYTPASKSLTYAVLNQDQGQDKNKTAKKLLDRWAQERGDAQKLPENWQDELRAGRLKYVLIIEPGFSKVLDKPNSKSTAKARLISEPGLDNNIFETNRMHLLSMVSKLRAEGFVSQLPKELPNQTPSYAQTPKLEAQFVSSNPGQAVID